MAVLCWKSIVLFSHLSKKKKVLLGKEEREFGDLCFIFMLTLGKRDGKEINLE